MSKGRTLALTLPWPDARLSPNKRIDRRALIAVKRDARNVTYAATNETGVTLRPVPLEMSLTFHAPDKRHRDLDNCFASMKSALDGIFIALGLDDCLIDAVLLRRGEIVEGGAVDVEVWESA